jgi:hypothetical protein
VRASEYRLPDRYARTPPAVGATSECTRALLGRLEFDFRKAVENPNRTSERVHQFTLCPSSE